MTGPSPSASLAGKSVLVTGAASGIGRAAVFAFAREGARIVAADIDVLGGEETAHEAIQRGAEAVFVRTDVSCADQVEELVAAAISSFGRLDCAFNNAGIEGPVVRIEECREEDFDRVIAVNLKGAFLCMKYEILHMREAGGGAIVNTASTAGLTGSRLLTPYGASKFGVVGLTRSAAIQCADDNIRVNAICPGFIDTPMLNRHPALLENARTKQRGPRFGTPEEVAETAVWLCSGAASFVNGVSLTVDGGVLA